MQKASENDRRMGDKDKDLNRSEDGDLLERYRAGVNEKTPGQIDNSFVSYLS